MTTKEIDPPCSYRGKEFPNSTFVCEIHGKCSILSLHPRIRPCTGCADRRFNQQGFQEEKLLGDMVEATLKSVGITQERVSSWLGEECNCDERIQKLNQLHSWAREVITGKFQKAKECLEEILR